MPLTHGLSIDQVMAILLLVRERTLMKAPLHFQMRKPRLNTTGPTPRPAIAPGESLGLAGHLRSPVVRSEFWQETWAEAFERYVPRRFAIQYQQQMDYSRQLFEKRRHTAQAMGSHAGRAAAGPGQEAFRDRRFSNDRNRSNWRTAPDAQSQQMPEFAAQKSVERNVPRNLLDDEFPRIHRSKRETLPRSYEPQPAAEKPRPSFGVHNLPSAPYKK